MKKLLIYIFLALIVCACKQDKPTSNTPNAPTVKVPAFEKDGAFEYVKKQCDFGPRVPGTEAHRKCKEWLVSELESFGATVHEQNFTAKYFSGEEVEATNIFASINPKEEKRILLSAHWDSRRVGENTKDENLRETPIDGADDGASGVGVILQIAKTIQANPIEMGVDIIFFDAEDQGERNSPERESWCLGSQHWSKNMYPKNYKPEYGILLDMVGSKNPRFAKDQVSTVYAKDVQTKIWNLANSMGYSDKFVNEQGNNITDDHYFVNVIAGIKMVDIINQKSILSHGFGAHWHTHDDNIEIIDRNSLRVVGQVVLATLYKESDGSI